MLIKVTETVAKLWKMFREQGERRFGLELVCSSLILVLNWSGIWSELGTERLRVRVTEVNNGGAIQRRVSFTGQIRS